MGAPTELVSAEGELVWHARRSLWGASQEPAPVPLRFPGQYADDETGLFYNLQRYYDPETGRYVSQDPLGLAPAPNPSAYVDNPTTTVDPLGLFGCKDAERLAEAHINDSGVTVLGSYRPPAPGLQGYIDKAIERGASYFDVGDNWSQLQADGLDRYANDHFLNIVTERGDKVLFSTPKGMIDPNTALGHEVDYLLHKRGYRWVNQWSMVPKG